MSLSSGRPRRFENQQSNKLISSDTTVEPLGPQTHQRGFSFPLNLYLLSEGRPSTAAFLHFHRVPPGSCPVQTTFHWWPLSCSAGAICGLSTSLKANSRIDNERRKGFFTFTTLLDFHPVRESVGVILESNSSSETQIRGSVLTRDEP